MGPLRPIHAATTPPKSVAIRSIRVNPCAISAFDMDLDKNPLEVYHNKPYEYDIDKSLSTMSPRTSSTREGLEGG